MGGGQAPVAAAPLFLSQSVPSARETAMLRTRAQHGDLILNINFCSSSCAGWHSCKEM